MRKKVDSGGLAGMGSDGVGWRAMGGATLQRWEEMAVEKMEISS
jgi:hypothetical protein